MNRVVISVLAVGLLLFGFAASGQAVPPRTAPALYAIIVYDDDGGVYDIGVTQLYDDNTAILLWQSEGFAERQGDWAVLTIDGIPLDYGSAGSVFDILDVTGGDEGDWYVDIDYAIYLAGLNLFVAECYDNVAQSPFLALGLGL